MTRFFVAKENFHEDQVFITGADSHHLIKVLRQKPGDRITVLNGKGEEFTAEISKLEAELVMATVISQSERRSEPRLRLTLVQSLPKADKFEWILQKNTENGVSRFQPVLTERSNIKLDRKALEHKIPRWRRIIQEAAEQSGRQVLPELGEVISWQQFLRSLPAGLSLIPWEGEHELSLRALLTSQEPAPSAVNIIIGPEGGFSLAEVEQAKAAGAIPVTLGPRILRTETAGLVVSSAILYHFGDLD